ncbi:MAG: GTPase HflX [Victivallaceae bacterium]|nr:GTPase HflX [Victivallaceae bacterium]
MIELAADAAIRTRALPIGITEGDTAELIPQLDELTELLANLDIEVLEPLAVRNRENHSRFKVGTGKAEEIARIAQECEADLLVFDEPLTPSQQRNWERLSQCKVIDREEVILEIFASRAQTREAVLQVELARAKYMLPRLTGAWSHLSRQRGGGATTRGKGEAQIETDRRLLRDQVRQLEEELSRVRRSRDTQRKARLRRPVAQGAIVGYTNVGKSSLLAALSGADVMAKDQLFATLDPLARQVALPEHLEAVLTDTVGFIRKLPHTLVEAFKSTLEESVIADFLLLVLDASSRDVDLEWETTIGVLRELGADEKKIVIVFNKCDKIPAEEKIFLTARLRGLFPDALFVSAATGEGLEQLRRKIALIVAGKRCRLTAELPAQRSDLVAFAYQTGQVEKCEYDDDGKCFLVFCIEAKHRHLYAEYLV